MHGPSGTSGWQIRDPGVPVGWLSSQEWPSERPLESRSKCYTDRFSYAAGDRVDVHVHTTAREYSLEVVREGLVPESVYRRDGLAGVAHETPADAYRVGCGWPVAHSIEIAQQWRSGFYLVIVRAEDGQGRSIEREHFFIVRAHRSIREGAVAFILTTSTLISYNDWGGANRYRGPEEDPADSGSPILSTQRPIARGLLRKPASAPRHPNVLTPPPFWQPRYDAYSWARMNGYTRHHDDAFWPTYERLFAVWAEDVGYRLDYLTQHDLHYDPTTLDGYSCAVIVGHDEYWSWEMRDAIDSFVDRGGGLARFAGNFLWQVRLADNGNTQICYATPPEADPISATSPHLTTTMWDAKLVGRPGAATMGLTATSGAYVRFGTAVPRGSGGYTVYRPEHWALQDTDLYYGDVFGAAPINIAAFEVDGAQYTIRRGLPYPTQEDGAPETLEIVALTPAVYGETDRWDRTIALASPPGEWPRLLDELGKHAPDYMREAQYGAAMIATFTHGQGAVLNTGSTEWVNGLAQHDPYTQQITHNALQRFGARRRRAG